jgi:glycosidase
VGKRLALALLAACASPLPPPHSPPLLPSPSSLRGSAWQSQVIYLVLPDRFFDGDSSNNAAGQPRCFDPADPNLFHGGDIAGLRAKTDYLKDLGVTAVWITPLAAQVPLKDGACGYHGYWADLSDPDDGTIEPKLGTADEVTALVKELHAAGMKLVLDMVVNHAGRGARVVTQHPDWFHDDATCATLGNRDWYCSLNGLPDFAQEKPPVAAYLSRTSAAWVSRVMPDGIRMDTAKHVAPEYFATSWVPAVRAVRSDLFLVAEVFDEGPYTHLQPILASGFDSAFNFPLRRALVDAFAKGGDIGLVADAVASEIATLGMDRALSITNMLDNHDVPRFLAEVPLDAASAELSIRYRLAMTALFTLPGIPQIYAGDELGMIAAKKETRRDMPDWAWEAATRTRAHPTFGYVADVAGTFDFVKKLIALRRGTPALYAGSYSEITRTGGAYAFTRSVEGDRVLVVLYGDAGPSGPVALHVSGYREGASLKDVLRLGGPESLSVSGGMVTVGFAQKGAAVYLEERSRP